MDVSPPNDVKSSNKNGNITLSNESEKRDTGESGERGRQHLRGSDTNVNVDGENNFIEDLSIHSKLNIEKSEKSINTGEFSKLVDKEITPSPIMEKVLNKSINANASNNNEDPIGSKFKGDKSFIMHPKLKGQGESNEKSHNVGRKTKSSLKIDILSNQSSSAHEFIQPELFMETLISTSNTDQSIPSKLEQFMAKKTAISLKNNITDENEKLQIFENLVNQHLDSTIYRTISVSTDSFTRPKNPQLYFRPGEVPENRINYCIDIILNDYVHRDSGMYHSTSGSLDKRRLTDESTRLHKCSSAEAAIHIQKFFEFLHCEFPYISTAKVKEIITQVLGSAQCELAAKKKKQRKNEANIAGDKVSEVNRIGDSKLSTDVNIIEDDEEIWNNARVWRSYYFPSEIKSVEIPPLLQAQPIDFKECPPIHSSLLKIVKTPFPVSLKLISRSPVLCPITECSENIFVSELPKHFNVNHLKIPMETISPRKGTNFFLEFRANRFGKNKCHLVYLIKEKIIELGHNSYKTLYPILVMSTVVHISEIISGNWNQKLDPTNINLTGKCVKFPLVDEFVFPNNSSDKYCMLIWLTGLKTNELKVSATLTVWANNGPTPVAHKSISSKIYSIRHPQIPKILYNSGNAILLTCEEVRKLTNNDRFCLQFQVMVH